MLCAMESLQSTTLHQLVSLISSSSLVEGLLISVMIVHLSQTEKKKLLCSNCCV